MRLTHNCSTKVFDAETNKIMATTNSIQESEILVRVFNKYQDLLDEFVRKVNQLSQEECDRINKNSNIFKAAHIHLPKSMLQIYFDQGHTPEETFKLISENDKLY